MFLALKCHCKLLREEVDERIYRIPVQNAMFKPMGVAAGGVGGRSTLPVQNYGGIAPKKSRFLNKSVLRYHFQIFQYFRNKPIELRGEIRIRG